MATEFKIPWFVGGIVPPGRLEEYVTMMLNHGVMPNELAPHLVNGMPQQAPQSVLQLPDHTQKKRSKKYVRKTPNKARPGGLREYLLKLLSKGPLLRTGIKEDVRAHRKGASDMKQLGTRLWELKRKKFATEENGTWTLTEAGMKLAREAIEPAGASPATPTDDKKNATYLPEKGGQADLVLRRLQKAHGHGKTVKLGVLYDMFQKKGLRPHSVSVAVHTLTKKGLAVQVGPAEYRYNPAPQAQEPTNA